MSTCAGSPPLQVSADRREAAGPGAVVAKRDVVEVVMHAEDRTPLASARTKTGAVRCWGSNDFVSLGTGDQKPAAAPRNLAGLTSNVVSVSSSCAVKTDGTVWCWKRRIVTPNAASLATAARAVPLQVSGLPSGVVQVVTSPTGTSCVLTSAGAVHCWGANEKGQVGIGSDDAYVSAPTQVTLPGTAKNVAAAGQPGAPPRPREGSAEGDGPLG